MATRAPAEKYRPRLIGSAGLLTLALATMAICGLAFTQTTFGDTLELKTGEVFQGKLVSASPQNIRFEVDGKERVFATSDVLNLGFSDVGDASTTATPAATPVPSADRVPTPATSARNAAVEPTTPPAETQVPAATASPDSSSSAAGDTPADSDDDAETAKSADSPQPAGVPSPTHVPRQGAQSLETVTVPAGMSLRIRMVDSVDSSTNQVSDPFHAKLDVALIVGTTVVAPAGADVYGMLARARASGDSDGSSRPTLELTGIRINGNIVPIDSMTFSSAGLGESGAVRITNNGDHLHIPSGALLEFTLEQDTTASVSATSN